MEKIAKGVKKAAKSSSNLVLGDDIRTLTSKNTKWYQKVVAGALIASDFVPGVGTAASVTAKVAVKGTVATVKAVKTTSSAKKAATAANKTPKTVPAKSIKSTPKIQESKSVKANNVTPQAPPKVNIAKQPDRGQSSAQKRTATPDCEGSQCTVPGQCFIAGTKVITDEGEKPIEEIQVGEKVLSQNVETGEKGYKEVKQLFVHEVDTLYHVQIKGITISNTEEHPYWVVGKGWVEAKDLKIGDQVLLASGEKAAIENVTKEKLETPVKVYNFEVADWHTYFVADIGVLVHNDCTGKDIGEGVVYKRTNVKTGEEYIGQAKSMERYEKRQAEHSRANKDARYEFEVIGRATPGKDLDILEQKKINEYGGLKKNGGLLENKRNQIREKKWEQNGIELPKILK
jgi:hypothetical protein